MGTFSIWHWIVVLIIVVLVFGTKKLRNLGSDLGGALKGFKEGMKESDSENNTSTTAPPAIEASTAKDTQNGSFKENKPFVEKEVKDGAQPKAQSNASSETIKSD